MSTIVKFVASGLAGLADALGFVGRAFSPACSLALRTRWLSTTTAASCGRVSARSTGPRSSALSRV